MAKTQKQKWFFIGLVGILLAAPNATVVKYTVGSLDPFFFNTIRFFIGAVVTAPFLLKDSPRFRRNNVSNALKAGVCMAIAVISYVWAIKLSHASYVTIITLITPILLVLYSAKLTGEKITSRALAGIAIAAVGAMIIVLLPIAIKQSGAFVFYPVATGLALLNCVTFPLSIIYFKRASEQGLPMGALMSLSAWVVFAINACFLLFQHPTLTLSKRDIFGILYSGVVVAIISRSMIVESYEHIGAAVSGALAYLETFIAILLPLAALNEKLSTGMVIGGALILTGVYVTEHHKSRHHKHYHLLRLHL